MSRVHPNGVAYSTSGPRAILRPEFVAVVEKHAGELDDAIIHARDFGFYLYVGPLFDRRWSLTVAQLFSADDA